MCKRLLKITIFLSLLQFSVYHLYAQQSLERWVSYEPDLTSVLKNPAMGWVMYEEGWSFHTGKTFGKNIYTPEVFWQQMEDVDAAKYSNILYIRMLWKDLEPEEGRYAWIYNEKYKWYIHKAKEHGLKLAFRVFFHGGVPEYVYQAGATQTEIDNEGKIQPHYDNPVFLQKLTKFIEAFAKEYDNPDVVDFVDAYGLGRWGEGHGITLKNPENMNTVINTVTEAYAKNFKKILTVINHSAADYKFTKPEVYDRLGFLPRRDGIGSYWFNIEERFSINNDFFPQKAFIGEGCYWFNSPAGDNSHYTAFKDDKRFKMDNYKEAFTVAVTDALENHSNTMDLRVPLQCKFWIEELPDQVQRFITLGGYRLYPDYIKLEKQDKQLTLLHSWKNHGVGVIPNRHPNWNHKYQVSFALLNENNQVKYLYSDQKTEPADWLKGYTYNYVTIFDVPNNLRGRYTLCVGITNKTKHSAAEIDLAVSEKLKVGKWVKVADIAL